MDNFRENILKNQEIQKANIAGGFTGVYENIEKAQTHKYFKREPDGKGGWKYYYTEAQYKEAKGEKGGELKVGQKVWFQHNNKSRNGIIQKVNESGTVEVKMPIDGVVTINEKSIKTSPNKPNTAGLDKQEQAKQNNINKNRSESMSREKKNIEKKAKSSNGFPIITNEEAMIGDDGGYLVKEKDNEKVAIQKIGSLIGISAIRQYYNKGETGHTKDIEKIVKKYISNMSDTQKEELKNNFKKIIKKQGIKPPKPGVFDKEGYDKYNFMGDKANEILGKLL